MTEADWDPQAYGRFAGLRLRPALDLLFRVGALPEGGVVDLGCGNGAVGPLLWSRFKGRPLTGVDASPAMLARAGATRAYDRLVEADAGPWVADTPPALIFSNALLHWLADHAALMPRLAAMLAPGGTLAVQMPRQFDAPSHRLLREIAAERHPDRFDWRAWAPPVAAPESYQRLLGPLGEVSVWESLYLQRLEPSAEHPVRLFTQSTALRPIAARLDEAETLAFLAAYDTALEAAYPREPDGGVLFPFRRLFFTLRRG